MRLSQRLTRTVVSLALLVGTTAVAVQVMAGPAAADEAQVLPISSAADMAVDGVHQRIFISDPVGGRLPPRDHPHRVSR